MHIIPINFTKLGTMVVDPCVGTEATAEAFLMQWHHQRFSGCDNYGTCVESMILSLLETFASENLNKDCDVVDIVDVGNTGMLYLRHCTCARIGLTRMSWKTLKGLPASEAFRRHMTQ